MARPVVYPIEATFRALVKCQRPAARFKDLRAALPAVSERTLRRHLSILKYMGTVRTDVGVDFIELVSRKRRKGRA